MKTLLLVVVLVAGCATAATSTDSTTTPTPTFSAEARARDDTLELVRKSIVQRVVREAPAVTRGGVARLVTMVPLDEARMNKLAPAVSKDLSVERLENEVGLRVEKTLSDDELHALADALAKPDVAAVVDAAVASDPANSEIERFIEDPKALDEARRAKVKALVEVTWSPIVVDKLTRAPVSAAGRIVASATLDERHRVDLLRIADNARPGDPDALVVAFAFLWRDLDDATLESARAWFASELGVKTTKALVDAAVTSIDAVAAGIEHDVQS